jgi:hypothetical protein
MFICTSSRHACTGRAEMARDSENAFEDSMFFWMTWLMSRLISEYVNLLCSRLLSELVTNLTDGYVVSKSLL